MSEDRDTATDALASALRTLKAERRGLDALVDALRDGLGAAFRDTVTTIHAATGRVIVAGIGKSGHVGRKIAATLASTGTPAYFVHAAEASHGDLGMIVPDDVILALSWSGETLELTALIDYATRFRVRLIAITSVADSSLARAATHALILPRAPEACPNGLAPTTSTTMQMALGDALAVALLEARGFSAGDFRVFHPGGRLGAQLRRVDELMHTGDRVPVIDPDAPIADAIAVMSEKGFGCVLVLEPDGRLAGIVTDGDVRRAFGRRITGGPVSGVMSRKPATVARATLAAEAVEIMNSRRITTLVIAEEGRAVGLLHMHDLLRAGVA